MNATETKTGHPLTIDLFPHEVQVTVDTAREDGCEIHLLQLRGGQRRVDLLGPRSARTDQTFGAITGWWHRGADAVWYDASTLTEKVCQPFWIPKCSCKSTAARSSRATCAFHGVYFDGLHCLYCEKRVGSKVPLCAGCGWSRRWSPSEVTERSARNRERNRLERKEGFRMLPVDMQREYLAVFHPSRAAEMAAEKGVPWPL